MNLAIDHLIRIRSLYRSIRRERPDVFASLPFQADWLTFRYVRSDSIRRMAACTFSDPPVIAIHPRAFEWKNGLLLRGLLHHEMCHIVCGAEAGHGEFFRSIERRWASFAPYELQRASFSRALTAQAQREGLVLTYECPECLKTITRKRPLKQHTACSECCKAFNGGKWCESYTFKKVEVVG